MSNRQRDNGDFHEVWWIYSDHKFDWAGLRIAHFRKTMNGDVIFFISDETLDRVGPRIWDDVSKREGWRKVERIPVPVIIRRSEDD